MIFKFFQFTAQYLFVFFIGKNCNIYSHMEIKLLEQTNNVNIKAGPNLRIFNLKN